MGLVKTSLKSDKSSVIRVEVISKLASMHFKRDMAISKLIDFNQKLVGVSPEFVGFDRDSIDVRLKLMDFIPQIMDLRVNSVKGFFCQLGRAWMFPPVIVFA